MNPTDTCPDCNQTIEYHPTGGDFVQHDISPSMRAVCSGSGTFAPAAAQQLPQQLQQQLQQALGGQMPPGFPGFPGQPGTTFDPPVKKPKRPSKVESLAKALMSDVMAPPPTKLDPPKPGEACSKHGLSATAGVACGFCQMEYDQQQPVEFKADHSTNQPKHMDGSPCTQTDQCPWSFTAWNALNTRLGQRELDEMVVRLSGADQNVGPITHTMTITDDALEALKEKAGIPAETVVNNTGLPDDVARSLGLL